MQNKSERSIHSDMVSFFAELDEQRQKRQHGAKRAFELSAAVLVHFDLDTIEPGFDISIEDRETLVSELIDGSMTVVDGVGKPHQMLVDRVRQRILRKSTLVQLKTALKRNPKRSKNHIQKIMDAYILGKAVELTAKNYQQLRDISRVIYWLEHKFLYD